MEYMGKAYISATYKKDDYINLNLTISSDDNDWNEAINMFEERIKGRYINVMDKIISEGSLVIDGFSVIAINCLLIETLLQFKNGWDETSGGNASSYSKFLKDEFPNIFTTRTLARKFYSDIRCGILHSAQTKNGSQLTINEPNVVAYINGRNSISVDVKGMFEATKEYINNYINKLRDRNNIFERESFISKMNYICIN